MYGLFLTFDKGIMLLLEYLKKNISELAWGMRKLGV